MAPTQAGEIQQRLSEAVVDMLEELRIQLAAGPLPDTGLDHIIFRAAHRIVQVLAAYDLQERNALWPSVIRMLLAEFIRQIGITDAMHGAKDSTGRGPS